MPPRHMNMDVSMLRNLMKLAEARRELPGEPDIRKTTPENRHGYANRTGDNGSVLGITKLFGTVSKTKGYKHHVTLSSVGSSHS